MIQIINSRQSKQNQQNHQHKAHFPLLFLIFSLLHRASSLRCLIRHTVLVLCPDGCLSACACCFLRLGICLRPVRKRADGICSCPCTRFPRGRSRIVILTVRLMRRVTLIQIISCIDIVRIPDPLFTKRTIMTILDRMVANRTNSSLHEIPPLESNILFRKHLVNYFLLYHNFFTFFYIFSCIFSISC